MPLKPGSSDDVVSQNIATLIREGKSRDQAVAIAYSNAGRGKRGKNGRLSIEQATALDVPLSRWANGLLGGKGGNEGDEGDEGDEVGVRVPESPQETNYTCGPAALRGALAAFGLGAEEDELAAAAGTSASGGTSAEGLAQAAEQQGLEVEVLEGMTLGELTDCLARGCVALACIQAGEEEAGYDSSHWVVPCRVGDGEVECMDPSVEGARSVCSEEEFLARWHCVDMSEQVSGLAVLLRGDAPANMTAIDQAQTPL